jgi:hypothetical protein
MYSKAREKNVDRWIVIEMPRALYKRPGPLFYSVIGLHLAQ